VIWEVTMEEEESKDSAVSDTSSVLVLYSVITLSSFPRVALHTPE